MQTRSQQELYRAFIDLILSDAQRERRVANRRMRAFFVWCFLVPVLISLATLLLIRAGVLARSVRAYLEWVVLAFPLGYAIYVLIFEVISELPSVLRRGGVAATLDQAV